MVVGWVIVCVIASLPLFWSVGALKRLSALRTVFRVAFAKLDGRLERRYALIARLMEHAKTRITQEEETIGAVSAARNSASSARQAASIDPGLPSAMAQMSNAENVLSAALARFFALSEAYQDLKADATFQRMLHDLEGLESKITFSKQAVTDAASRYNAACAQAPASTIAKLFGFKRVAPLRTVDAVEERRAPAVLLG